MWWDDLVKAGEVITDWVTFVERVRLRFRRGCDALGFRTEMQHDAEEEARMKKNEERI